MWAPVDVSDYRGKTLRIEVAALPKDSQALELASLDDEPRVLAPIYHEKLRPQFHFTSQPRLVERSQRTGVLGRQVAFVLSAQSVWLELGQYALGTRRQRRSDRMARTAAGALCRIAMAIGVFPGRAVVDDENTSGFKKGDGDLLVWLTRARAAVSASLTAMTRDFHGPSSRATPSCGTRGGDPRLLWHAPTKRWVMAVYDETDGKRWIAFHTSPDLKIWEFASRIEGFFECPDLFEITSDDDESLSQWVLYGADGKYVLGKFDGRVFTPETEKQQLWHGNFYAAQTYSNSPDGRRVQIGWRRESLFPTCPSISR